MEPDAARRGTLRVRALREQRGDHAGQHVAAAALGECAAAAGVLQHPSVRQGDERAVALAHQRAAVPHGEVPRGLRATALGELFERDAQQPRQLPVVGCEDRHAAPPRGKSAHALGQRVQPIGVQHHRLFCLPQQSADQPRHIRAAPKAGAEGEHITFRQLRLNRREGVRGQLFAVVTQGEGHGGGALRRLDRPDAPRHAEVHQPRAGAHGGARREVRRAGIAHRAADDEQLAEVALVSVRFSGWHGVSDVFLVNIGHSVTSIQ